MAWRSEAVCLPPHARLRRHDWTTIISELRQQNWTGAIDIEGWHDPVYRGDLEMTGQVFGLKPPQALRGGAFVVNPVV